AILLPYLDVNRTGITSKAACVDGTFGANDIGFIIVTRGMGAAKVQSTQHIRRSGKGDESCVAPFVNWAVIGFRMVYTGPDFVGKLLKEEDRFVSDMDAHIDD